VRVKQGNAVCFLILCLSSNCSDAGGVARLARTSLATVSGYGQLLTGYVL
jgi:hypothetical protein